MGSKLLLWGGSSFPGVWGPLQQQGGNRGLRLTGPGGEGIRGTGWWLEHPPAPAEQFAVGLSGVGFPLWECLSLFYTVETGAVVVDTKRNNSGSPVTFTGLGHLCHCSHIQAKFP